MLSLFQRKESKKEAEIAPRAIEGAANPAAPSSATNEPPAMPKGHPEPDSIQGLIHADELPSAAEAFAEIFPSEPAEAKAGRGRSRLGSGIRFLWTGRTKRDSVQPERTSVGEASGDSSPSTKERASSGIAAEVQAGVTSEPTVGSGSATGMIPIVAAEDASEPIALPTGGSETRGEETTDVIATTAHEANIAPEISQRPEATSENAAGDSGEPPAVSIESSSGSAGNEGDGRAANAVAEDTSGSGDFKAEKPDAGTASPAPEGAGMSAAERISNLLREPSSDWALEEKLASHGEWLESQGAHGKKADFAGADLEGRELIGVELRYADLHEANLRAADLLLGDLRDACLVRADLEDSCLVGTNLEGANLEGASLETAMGLVPRQLAGTDLRDAVLPPHILEFEAAPKFERAERTAFRYFVVLTGTSLISWLAIWRTKDVQLLTDSAAIPLVQPRVSAALPIAEMYLLMPLLLLILYLVSQFHLQRMWSAVLELPAVFPDGHTLEENAKGIIGGLLRAQFRWINREASRTLLLEGFVSIGLAYWITPFTLLLFWARYLTVQQLRGTVLQAVFVAVAAGVALHATVKTNRPPEKWARERKWPEGAAARLRRLNPTATAIGLAVALLFLSAGAILGLPHDQSRASQYPRHDVRRWASIVLWSFGLDPYADLTEAGLSRWPADQAGATDDSLTGVIGPHLNNAKFRYAQAYGIVLANAHLWQADFEGAFLSDADLRGADLGESSLRLAVADGARMNHANFNRANLQGANLSRADLRDANLSYASLEDATLVDARLDGANLYSARLSGANLARASLERVDLRGAQLDGAHLDHVVLRGAYLWSAKLSGADLGGAQLESAIFIGADLHGANLGGARFAGTVVNEADLSGTSLEGADLRGALGLTASQVCSARSRRGAILVDGLQSQVDAQCGR